MQFFLYYIWKESDNHRESQTTRSVQENKQSRSGNNGGGVSVRNGFAFEIL